MKIGFVSLVGNSNVGKSTILNLLSKKKISIVTPKKQTTRNNIISIINDDNYQITISDTPGFHNAKNVLGKNMNRKIVEAIKKSDLVILILSAKEKINREKFNFFLNRKIDLIVLNKIDLIYLTEAENIKKEINKLFPKIKIIEMCGIDGFNSDFLLQMIVNKMPNKNIKSTFSKIENNDDIFYSKEIIREIIFLNLNKELPYHTAVYVNDFIIENNQIKVDVNIFVNKESQKIIMIGKKGQMLKRIRLNSQRKLKEKFKKKVLINLFVKVKKNWFNSINFLKELGY